VPWCCVIVVHCECFDHFPLSPLRWFFNMKEKPWCLWFLNQFKWFIARLG